MSEKGRKGRPPTDADTITQALALIEEGVSPVEAALRVGVGKSTVYEWIKRRGASPRAAPGEAPARPVDRDRPAERASPEPGPRAVAIARARDDLAAMDAMIEVVAGKLEFAPESRVGSLASTLAGLITRRAKMRPPTPPSPEELERKAKPIADEVIEMIEKHVRAAEEELGLL